MTMQLPLLISICGLAVFAALMVRALVGDVGTFRIRNKHNLAIAGCFLLFAVPMGMGWVDIISHVKIAAITFAVTMSMFLIGIFGGGDAKFTGAIALWLGPSAMIPFIFYTAVSGGVVVFILLVARKLARHFGLPRSPKWARRILRKSRSVPYGVALGLGALIAVPKAVWFPDHVFG
jgi:prepilin peptidase CpaA